MVICNVSGFIQIINCVYLPREMWKNKSLLITKQININYYTINNS